MRKILKLVWHTAPIDWRGENEEAVFRHVAEPSDRALMYQAHMSPHECHVPACPGAAIWRRLQAADKLLEALEDHGRQKSFSSGERVGACMREYREASR